MVAMAVKPAFVAVPPPRFSMPICREPPIEPGQRRRLSNLSIGPVGIPQAEPAPQPHAKEDTDQKEVMRFPSVESLLNSLN
jgi:hypothetical protein